MSYYTSTWSAPAPTKEWAPNPCPTCGGLQCLCRPRFFAGQLLTEEDLNRLEHYIIEKNKLHNRYLHGWGTVCGLEVICSPCAGQVTVTSGYALSPCGEDILVCKDDTVNVCDLIRACKDKQRRQLDCEPPSFGNGNGCQEVPEDWILAIRYDEKPSRGITALRASTSSTCCSRCSCGGSSSCGCSCHAQTNGTMKNGLTSSRKGVSAQCEPTITCEGYVYEVYKAPTTNLFNSRNMDRGPLVARFNACIEDLAEAIPPLPSDINSPNFTSEQAFAWCCLLKRNLQDLFSTHETYDCLLSQKLAAFVCPDPDPKETGRQYLDSIGQLSLIGGEYLFYCFCSVLLPPCPEPVNDSRVPLATITVRKDSCQIIKVCDWDTRKITITFPNLEYWLSILPYGRLLRKCLQKFCCDPLSVLEARTTIGTTFANLESIFMPFAQKNDFSQSLFAILAKLVQCVFVNLSSVQASNILETLLAGTLPGAAGGPTTMESREEEINGLKTQLADLQKTMQAQQAQIDALSKK